MAFVDRVADAAFVELVHQALDHRVLHVPHCHNVLLAELASAFFEEADAGIAEVALLLVVGLFDEVDEGLGPHKLLKEALVLSHVLDVQVEVEDVIGRPLSEESVRLLMLRKIHYRCGGCLLICRGGVIDRLRACCRRHVEVLKSIDEEDEEVEELLLHFEGEVVPEPFFLPSAVLTHGQLLALL